MDEHEKITFAATVAAHEEILAALLSHVVAATPEPQLALLRQRLQQGPVLNPGAAPAPDIDTADRIAAFGIEYDQVIQRIFAEALAQAGR
jgi:hypothetical protein